MPVSISIFNLSVEDYGYHKYPIFYRVLRGNLKFAQSTSTGWKKWN